MLCGGVCDGYNSITMVYTQFILFTPILHTTYRGEVGGGVGQDVTIWLGKLPPKYFQSVLISVDEELSP